MTHHTEQFVTEDTILACRNGKGPSMALMSLTPSVFREDGKVTTVDLVIGAWQDDSCASLFGKKDLVELAGMLLAIAEKMDHYDRS